MSVSKLAIILAIVAFIPNGYVVLKYAKQGFPNTRRWKRWLFFSAWPPYTFVLWALFPHMEIAVDSPIDVFGSLLLAAVFGSAGAALSVIHARSSVRRAYEQAERNRKRRERLT